MDQQIIYPRPYSRSPGNRQSQIGGEVGYPQTTSSTWQKGNILVLSTGTLSLVASHAVLACGIATDAANTDTTNFPQNPPYDLFGSNHYPFDLHGLSFYINIGTLSGGATGNAIVGQANSAVQLSSVTIGTTYGIATATTGAYAGYQFLDPTNTSQLLLTVTGIPTLQGVATNGNGPVAQTSATYNGIVIATISGSLLQNLN